MVLPQDIVERLWALAQEAPLLFEVTLPIRVKKSIKDVPLLRGRRWHGRQGLVELLAGVDTGKNGHTMWACQKVWASGQDLVRTLCIILFTRLLCHRRRAPLHCALSPVQTTVARRVW